MILVLLVIFVIGLNYMYSCRVVKSAENVISQKKNHAKQKHATHRF